MNTITQRILQIFDQNGTKKYGIEPVTQRQHALQCASLAKKEGADDQLIVAALLHDIGHIMFAEDIPDSVDENLHDQHEEKAYHWLLEHFGARVADPVRLHVAAKRYLCTIEKNYVDQLSETSQKSFLDQGGLMNGDEKLAFEAESHFKEAVRLRRWDDRAKDPEMETKNIHHFVSVIEKCLRD